MLKPRVLKRVAYIANELNAKQPRIIIGTDGALLLAISDAEGLAHVEVIEGAPARVEVVSSNWWQVAQSLLDEDLIDKTAKDAGEKSQIIDIKLNRGQPIDLPTERNLMR